MPGPLLHSQALNPPSCAHTGHSCAGCWHAMRHGSTSACPGGGNKKPPKDSDKVRSEELDVRSLMCAA